MVVFLIKNGKMVNSLNNYSGKQKMVISGKRNIVGVEDKIDMSERDTHEENQGIRKIYVFQK